MARYEFSYPSQTDSEERMLDDLEAALRAEKIPLDGLRGFMVATCEAFTNALLHGNRSDTTKQIKVALEVNESTIRADITDEGKGGLEQIAGRKDRGLMAEGGRGIALIEHYADTVTFAENDLGGLRVSILVVLHGKHQTHA